MVTQVVHRLLYRACSQQRVVVTATTSASLVLSSSSRRQFSAASPTSFDLKNRRLFLKRSKSETLSPASLYINSVINVHSRQLKIVDYGDKYTQNKLETNSTLGLIKPDATAKMGQILDRIADSGLLLTKLKMCHLSRSEAAEFYAEHNSKPFFNELLHYMTSAPIVALGLMGHDSINKWRDMLGPTDSTVARKEKPTSIRAEFGTDKGHNAAHGSLTNDDAIREFEFFFSQPSNRKNTAQFTNCTCCVIKPHAVANGVAGKIISSIIDSGFEISALEMFSLDRANAEEFLEVYKDVVAEYADMVQQLTTGPCIAMEIRAQDAPVKFREFVGPSDPEIARHLRPRTLRALFGKDKIQNAIHCTDLPEDALLEVEYFFKILSRG
ncbi:nucleoside diphosphate kinase homolog 7-like isoform X2 [Tubulanus polymorphus]|uniref:nucleoside diphosphate kinase homolog 7-like isoform X2 n=1 Tax=Tubulanus polymorphus TaxID=672921 RepID=UPI003DA22528